MPILPALVVALSLFLAWAAQNQETPNNPDIRLQEKQSTSDAATATIEGPVRIRAGETAKFTVTLTPVPRFEGGSLSATIGPVGGQAAYSSGVQVVSGQNVYEFSVLLPSDAMTGIWELRSLSFGGMQRVEISIKNRLVFDVLPPKDIVYPTTAEVNINLDQKQLFRTEASRLQKRIQELKASLATISRDSALEETLARSVYDSTEALTHTENRFFQLSAGSVNSQNSEAAKVFFADLRRSYDDALSTIREHERMSPRSASLTSEAAWPSRTAGQKYPAAAHVVLRSLEQNELAYTLAADTESCLST